ncbi:MAG: MFS transporter [Clostridia bacterium]|nr:MFS transporter [Clostridia bacterium]
MEPNRIDQVSAEEQAVTPKVDYTRRYVGNKETAAYIMQDYADSFSIGKYSNRFIWDVVNIDFNIAGVVNLFTGAWDIINDTIIGVFVDRTRTRWGKFRPFLIWMKIPLTIFGALYWFMPLIFPNTAGTYLPKLIYYFAFSVINETAGTFISISQTGLLSTITPNPNERVRLISLAKFFSRFLGEKIPEMAMGVLLDLVRNNIVKWELSNVFIGMGLATSILSAGATFWFYMVSRERVVQSVERPSIRQGFRAILNNKPILLITLSNFLAGFGIGQSRSDYYIDVLGSASLQTIVGIPAYPILNISYSFVAPLRRRFSSKSLWVFEDLWTDACWLVVFALGSFKNNFMKRSVMIPTMAIEEIFEMCVYGIRHVIPDELTNEAMDYCEWKNGYRVEAMTGVAQGLVSKIQGRLMDSVKNFIFAKIGYEQGKLLGTQSDRAKWWLFALGTGVPIITGALGVIPKLFYPIDDATRKIMYDELLERRSAVAQAMQEDPALADVAWL